MVGTHDKIIAKTAKATLGPLGFQRKGRSRTWVADHGWWVTVVEFQPSSWSKGSYLNVAAHWLWSAGNHLSFDYAGRIKEHVEYVPDTQFTEAASLLAGLAEDEALRLSDLFISLSATATVLLSEERKLTGGGWMAYHAGIVAALEGLRSDANDMFARVMKGFASPDSLLTQAASRMADLLDDPRAFRDEVTSLILQHRAALQLPALADSPL
ncbi:hypothetical protein [Novosphingobium sp. BL-52-GroH]|uniref:hypothetical protein n=1 Tax=Novosphingobium sp. BL-52-GroH TaxID=3349877 RepID=UPI00385168FC